MADFIDNLPICVADKAKLRQLGVESPAGLLSLMEAAPGEFEAFLGHSTAEIRRSVIDLVPNAEQLLGLGKKTYPLGANLSAAPVLKPLPFDIDHRDRLFHEWQMLQGNPLTRESKRTLELQAELSALMER